MRQSSLEISFDNELCVQISKAFEDLQEKDQIRIFKDL
jgi:hypothetical protein